MYERISEEEIIKDKFGRLCFTIIFETGDKEYDFIKIYSNGFFEKKLRFKFDSTKIRKII